MTQRSALFVSVLLAACGGGAKSAGPALPVAPIPGQAPAPAPAATDDGPHAANYAAAPLAAAEPVATRIRSVEGITEYSLPNGLRVLLFPDPSQSTVTVDITYLVGSRLEGYGETGMAHLLEHMMFKGSPKFRNVLKLVEGKGGQGNGNTWTDRTTYFETLPATGDNLDWALDLEADRMLHASISQEDLSTEFSVVRNEFEKDENDPSSVLEQRLLSTAYLWHNYGKDTIGSRADIERVPVPALRAFYEKYYQPDNAVLVVVGKFDDKAALAAITQKFGTLAKPTRVIAPTYTLEPQQDGERTVTLRRNGDVGVVAVGYHTVGAASPEYPAVQAALDLLSREPSGRLYKKLVETKLVATLSAGQLPFRDPYVAIINATLLDPKNLDKVQAIITSEVEGLGASKIDDKEIARWRSSIEKQLALLMTNSEQLAIQLAESSALGDWRALFAYRTEVGKVTAADVRRVAIEYFKRSNRTSGQFIPTKTPDRAPLTHTPDIAAVVDGIDGGDAGQQGEVFAATLDNIDARTTRTDLPGGLKVALLPKKTRGGKVTLLLQLHFGDEKSLQGKAATAELMGALLSRGTTKHTFQELAEISDQLKSEISVSAEPSTLSVKIDTLRDHLPAALDLAAEMLRTPAFSDKQLELVRQESLASLQQQLADPSTLASITRSELRSQWPKSDPRYRPLPAEEIAEVKKVKLADIKAFYKDFVGANHGELSVVGDFDPAAITAQVTTLFGTWQSKKPYARLAAKAFGVAGVDRVVDVRDKEMAQIAVGFDVPMRDTDPDYPAWLMVGQVLGGDTGSRLWMRIREHEGLSYGTDAYTFAQSLDDAGGFGGDAIVAPQNMARAKASMLDEIAKMSAAPVTTVELERAKDAYIKGQDTELADDNAVLGMLGEQLFVGRTSAWTAQLHAKIRAVTVDDVLRVAKKYLQPSRLITVESGDLAKVNSQAPTPAPASK